MTWTNWPLVVCVLLTAPTVAQEPTFRAQSNVVTVPALVKDGKGNIVYGLQAQDFIIEDDGAVQETLLDEAADSEPLSVVLVLQVGRRAFREFPRIRGLSAMLTPIFSQPRSQVAIVEFDSAVSLVQDFTNRESSIADQLEQTRSGDGGAAILDAVQYSVHLLDHTPEGHRRVMLLISETRDHGSHIARIKNIVTEVGNSNTVVYALPFSPSLSQVLDSERGSNKGRMGGGSRPACSSDDGFTGGAQERPEGNCGYDGRRVRDVCFAKEFRETDDAVHKPLAQPLHVELPAAESASWPAPSSCPAAGARGENDPRPQQLLG
jgi:hypothetical protein